MGQTEILKFLEKNKRKWFLAREIAEAIGVTNPHKSLMALRQTNFIKVKEVYKVLGNRKAHMYMYKRGE